MILNKVKNNRISKDYQKLINEINFLYDDLKILSNSQLRYKYLKLKKEYSEKKNLNSLLPQTFALTKEFSSRVLGLSHFDVQLMAGIVLNNNKIAEMKTGEGKTLVATLPAALNALTEKGVHIVTVNDYLARRDQKLMSQIYRSLGLNTGLIQENMTQLERQKNYNSDITYVTNNELTFDYLRDNTSYSKSNLVLPPFHYCIIDEIDSILIDEAQTPIILANPIEGSPIEKFIAASEIIKYLELNFHYKFDEKNRNAVLTELGCQRVTEILEIQSLYDINEPWISYVTNALKAKTLFFNNVHYIIQNQRVLIVDEFTGRIMPDRRWSDGLHQAIEAKENLPIRTLTETRALVTYQNFFLMYPKISGMTGTGKTAEIEFEKIYDLSVTIIPTFRSNKRLDLPDFIFKDQFSKWTAISKFCDKISKTGQPVLIAATTIEKSDMLSELLDEYKLAYQLLNAKPENVRRESEIVAQAGTKNTITISTNMAGRGTDIILGGNINFQVEKKLYNLLKLIKPLIFELKNSSTPRHFRSQLISKIRNFKNIKFILGSSQKFYSLLFSLIFNSKFSTQSNLETLRMLQENEQIFLPKQKYQCTVRMLINEFSFINTKHHIQDKIIIKNLGGLYVIGTERNNSKRVDNQLRGRCGRQGDPGISQFFLSLDDTLLRLFGGIKLQQLFQNQILDDSPIQDNILNDTLDSAQQRVEERAYESRRNLFKYDDILNQQRQITYLERRLIINNKINQKYNLIVAEQLVAALDIKFSTPLIMVKKLKALLGSIINQNFIHFLLLQKTENKLFPILNKTYDNYSQYEWLNFTYQKVWINYQLRINELLIYDDALRESLEQIIRLFVMDIFWKDHIEKMTLLRDSVGWRAYGQKNPLTEYKIEAYYSYSDKIEYITYLIVYYALKLRIY